MVASPTAGQGVSGSVYGNGLTTRTWDLLDKLLKVGVHCTVAILAIMRTSAYPSGDKRRGDIIIKSMQNKKKYT